MIDALILTCERDIELAQLCARGLERFWPQVRPRLVWDMDRSTETDLPDDIRAIVRRAPYLRRVFDFPYIATTDTVCVLDSDCLTYDTPVEFTERSFQSNPGGPDHPAGLELWQEMGVTLDCHNARFCAGTYTMGRELFIDGRDTAIEWVRRCVKKGYDQLRYPGIVLEQSLIAGLWRQAYPHNPLPAERYPYIFKTPGCAMWHVGSLGPNGHRQNRTIQRMIAAYREWMR